MGLRSGVPGAALELRAFLLDEKTKFRELMTDTLLLDSAESGRTAWTECSKAVDALAGGRPYRLRTWELPPDHWAWAYGVDADWLLEPDNVLRPVV